MKLRQALKIAKSTRATAWMDAYMEALSAGKPTPEPIWRMTTDWRCVDRLFKWTVRGSKANHEKH